MRTKYKKRRNAARADLVVKVEKDKKYMKKISILLVTPELLKKLLLKVLIKN